MPVVFRTFRRNRLVAGGIGGGGGGSRLPLWLGRRRRKGRRGGSRRRQGGAGGGGGPGESGERPRDVLDAVAELDGAARQLLDAVAEGREGGGRSRSPNHHRVHFILLKGPFTNNV